MKAPHPPSLMDPQLYACNDADTRALAQGCVEQFPAVRTSGNGTVIIRQRSSRGLALGARTCLGDWALGLDGLPPDIWSPAQRRGSLPP